MVNPILHGVGQNSLIQNLSTVRQMFNQIRMASNPQAMMNQLLQNNPKMKEVNNMIQQAGGDPKKAFYQKAQEMGVDPNEILNQLR